MPHRGFALKWAFRIEQVHPPRGCVVPNARMVLTRCPTLGIEIPAGILCDQRTFAELTRVNEPARVRCPVCKDDHEWKPSEARLAPSLQPPTEK